MSSIANTSVMQKLESTLLQAKQRLDKERAKAKGYKEEIATLKEQLLDYEDVKSKLKKLETTHQRFTDEQTVKFENLSQEGGILRRRVQALEKENENLRHEGVGLALRCKQAYERSNVSQERRVHAERKLSNVGEILLSLTREKKKAEDTVERLTKNISYFGSGTVRYVEKAFQLRSMAVCLMHVRSMAVVAVHRLKARLKDKNRQIEGLVEENDNVNQKNKDLHDRLFALSHTIKNMPQQRRRRGSSLQQAQAAAIKTKLLQEQKKKQAQRDEDDEEWEELENKLAAAQQEIEKWKTTASDLSIQAARWKQAAFGFEEKFESILGSMDVLENNVDRIWRYEEKLRDQTGMTFESLQRAKQEYERVEEVAHEREKQLHEAVTRVHTLQQEARPMAERLQVMNSMFGPLLASRDLQESIKQQHHVQFPRNLPGLFEQQEETVSREEEEEEGIPLHHHGFADRQAARDAFASGRGADYLASKKKKDYSLPVVDLSASLSTEDDDLQQQAFSTSPRALASRDPRHGTREAFRRKAALANQRKLYTNEKQLAKLNDLNTRLRYSSAHAHAQHGQIV